MPNCEIAIIGGGAEAIGLGDEVGAITVGRRADLIQVRLDEAPRLTALYNVISHLVYATNSDDVDTVVVNGEILMRSGRVRTLDVDGVRREANKLARKIETAILSQKEE